MKQAILHLGFHKAGSSSVQLTFTLNRRVLERQGWRYAWFTEYGRDSYNHSVPLHNLFVQHAGELPDNLRVGKSRAEQMRRYRAELDDNLKSDLPLIFSGEGGSMLRKPGLRAMRRTFEDAGWRPRVIIFVRPPTEFAESMAQQLIKGGSPDRQLPAPLGEYVSARITRIREVFPEAEFYPFSRVKAHPGGPAGFMADLIEPGLAAKLVVHSSNSRISANAADLTLHVNRLLPFFVDFGDGQQVHPLRLHGDTRPLFALSGERFFLGAEELDGIRDQIARQNDWLDRNLGPEFCDARTPPARGAVQWHAGHAAELRRLFRHLPRHIRVAAADYFRDRPDLPEDLQALPQRYSAGWRLWLRYARGGPGVRYLEKAYRKVRGQW